MSTDAVHGADTTEEVPEPGSLQAALAAYDTALLAHDVAGLNAAFLDSETTLRADASGVLVGYDAIARFRARADPAPTRAVRRQHVVPLTEGAALTVAETARPDGTPGLQTQAWVRTERGWRIAAAHVSTTPAPAAASPDADAGGGAGVDGGSGDSVWRVAGDPLVAGAPTGPLHGLRVAVKDLYAVAGYAVGAGNPTWLAHAPVEATSATVVRQLLDAGADVAGIVRTDEFAYSLAGTNVHYGTPPNPAAPGRVTGGSSSGSASAVAQGQADVGLGTDTAGSIRVPASYCGLFGLRTGTGVLPATGLMPLAPSFDAPGWLTRDAATLVRVAHLLLPASDVEAPTRLILAEDLLELADDDVAARVEQATLVAAERLGLPVVRVPRWCDGQVNAWVAAFAAAQAAEAWTIRGGWLADRMDSVAPDIAARFAVGRDLAASERAQAEQTVLEARVRLRALVPAGTVVAQPAASTVAPPPDMSDQDRDAMRAATLRLTSVSSVSGLPALTVPAGTVGGRPVGLCLVGSRGADRQLADLGLSLEGLAAHGS